MMKLPTQREIVAAMQSNHVARAEAIADAAVGRGEADLILFRLAARYRQRHGDTSAMVEMLRSAVDVAPEDPAILTEAADGMRHGAELNLAVDLFDRALAIDPHMVAAWYGRGLAFEAGGALTQAEESFRRVATLAPDSAPGLAKLAMVQVAMGELSAARGSAVEAAAREPGNFMTIMALAMCDKGDGDDDGARARLSDLARRPDLPDQDRATVLGLFGDTLDGIGDTDGAFAAYVQAKQHFLDLHGGATAPARARAIIDAIGRDLAERPGPVRLGLADGPSPLIVTGFPRSGTTLVTRILATIPGVVTLEEAPTLRFAERYCAPGGVAALQLLNAAEVAGLRNDYWAGVRHAGVDPTGKTFVDMDPFKIPTLPLVTHLFPDARIVIVRRDPRDVIWSCFRHNFIRSVATLELADLTRAAYYYDSVMRLTERCLERLDLNVHIVRYRDVVRDFETTTRALCAFADLPWSENLRNFATKPNDRLVQTASAAQVRRGLYDGRGGWRRYATQLAPIMHVLQPWVERFGADD